MEINNFMDGVSFSIKGIFLLLLTLSSGYFKKYLGPNVNLILQKNIFMINLLLFSFIYFAITITNFRTNNSSIHPSLIFKISFGIYIFFIFFGKMEYYSTLITIILLLCAYLNYTYYRYYKRNNKNKKFKQLKKLQNILYFLIVLTLIIGFLINFKNKYINSNNKNKSLIKYLFI